MPDIINYIEQIFNYSISISYYPAYFKKSIIMILYKQKNIKNFTSLKSYQPISLLNIVEKIIKEMLVARISYMAIIYNLLLKTNFGG